jgi:DNA-directed RNA polymerase specialized sigma24 family protein
MQSFFEKRWRRTSLEGEVDDAVQESFVDCFRPKGALGRADASYGEFRGFLFGVVRNVARRFESRPTRRDVGGPGSTEMLDEVAGDGPGTSTLFDRVWAENLMREAGDRMRELAATGDQAARTRVEILRLRFTEGLPVRDIATELSLDTDAAHRAYARARAEFHVCLRQVVAEHAVRTEADLDAECRRLFELLE